jgi:precorrin-6Y C5,15-methyltransferase (decarboxylating)
LPEPIVVVGLGADGPASLSQEARATVETATVLAGGVRHLAFFPDHPALRIPLTAPLADAFQRLAAAREEGARVVVLASGDPNFFGVAEPLRRHFGAEAVRVLPHLASIQLAAARLGLPWQDFVFLSAHGRPLGPVAQRARAARRSAILTDDVHTPAAVGAALLAAGMPAETEVHLCERLGTDEERIRTLPLAGLPTTEADSLNLLLIVQDGTSGGFPIAFAQGVEAFQHTRGRITKPAVRALSLGQLHLRPFGVLWDVGAGSGSLAIEAALIAPLAAIFAVERDPEEVALLKENIGRHGTANVEVVAGEAPEALAALPAPDAVFVGGHGGRLIDILRTVLDRLKPGGRLVATFATLENAVGAGAHLQSAGLVPEVTLLSVASGRAGPGGTRLRGENPVYVLTAEKGGS